MDIIDNQQSPLTQQAPIQPPLPNQNHAPKKLNIILFTLGAIVVCLILVIPYMYITQNQALYPAVSAFRNLYFTGHKVANEIVPISDSEKKYTVDWVNELIIAYHARYGFYPKKLSDLSSIYLYSDDELKSFNNPVYHFESDGTTYEYYAKLNTGEIFKGDKKNINKRLDMRVVSEVDQAEQMVGYYYSDVKRLPKTLEEISTVPDLSYYKIMNNPFTGKPYTYIPNNGNGFTISGTLSDGTQYKREVLNTAGE